MLVWNPEAAGDAVWKKLREHFTDDQIVELGSFIGLTYGQQRVIKTWNVGHGEFSPAATTELGRPDVER